MGYVPPAEIYHNASYNACQQGGVKGNLNIMIFCLDNPGHLIIVGTFVFESGYPPSEKSGSSDWHGSKPVSEMVEFIINLPKREQKP